MTINIGLIGYAGRMGQAIAAALAAHPEAKLRGGLVRAVPPALPAADLPATNLIVTADPGALFPHCDVLIDFATAAATAAYARLAVQYRKPLVVGTTGHDDATKAALVAASGEIPVLYASNTSLSLVVMKQLVKLAASLLRHQDYDIAIVDEHHRWKQDAPSGTAKTLGDCVASGNAGSRKPAYAAIRAGAIVGEHEVIFAGQGETIRLRHSVTDRAIFARGAVQAALWLSDKPSGFYEMDNVLNAPAS